MAGSTRNHDHVDVGRGGKRRHPAHSSTRLDREGRQQLSRTRYVTAWTLYPVVSVVHQFLIHGIISIYMNWAKRYRPRAHLSTGRAGGRRALFSPSSVVWGRPGLPHSRRTESQNGGKRPVDPSDGRQLNDPTLADDERAGTLSRKVPSRPSGGESHKTSMLQSAGITRLQHATHSMRWTIDTDRIPVPAFGFVVQLGGPIGVGRYIASCGLIRGRFQAIWHGRDVTIPRSGLESRTWL